MRKTNRLQSAQALALAAVCAVQVAAPGLVQAETPPATPIPPPTAPAAPPPAVTAPATPAHPSPAGQAAPPSGALAVLPTQPGVPVEPAPTAPKAGQPTLPAAAEPSAPPAYIELMTTAAPTEPPVTESPVIEAAPTIDEQLVAEPKSKVPSYVMWGVGGASLITGVVLGVTALTAKSDFNDNPTFSAADKVEGRAVAADIAFGLSAVLLVTGTVFYFLPDSQESRPTASNPKRAMPRARVQFAPMLGRTNGGAVSVQF